MKKIIVILFSIVIQDSYSQSGVSIHLFNPVSEYKLPIEYRDNINKEASFGLEVKGNRQIKEGLLLRFSIGYTQINEGRERIFTDNQKTLISNKQNKIHLTPAILWQKAADKFLFFGGFEIPFNLHGEYRRSHNIYYYNEMLQNWEHVQEDELIYSSGFSFGIAPVFGFRYFVKDYFSINAELSNSLLYRNLGGEVTVINDSSVDSKFTDESKGITFFNQKISFGVAFWIWKE